MDISNIEKTTEIIKNKIPSKYYLSIEDLRSLLDIVNNRRPVQAVMIAFEYGFMKGTRAKARKRCPTL